MSITIKCASCGGDVTHAKIEAAFETTERLAVIYLKLKCPACGDEYTSLAQPTHLVNDGSLNLEIYRNKTLINHD